MSTDAIQRKRAGFTLMEVVVAMVASVFLLAGLGSVMLIARQIAYTPAASVHRLEAAGAFDELADELRFATYVTERSPGAIEFVVTDRTGDDVPERIRYSWSGTAGDPLLKTVNGGTPSPLIDAVEQLQFTYTVDTDTTTVATTSETAETLLASDTDASGEYKLHVKTTDWFARGIDPATFVAAPPADAIGWKPTRAEFLCKNRAGAGEYLLVQVRSTGAPDDGPTGESLTGVRLTEPDLEDTPIRTVAQFPLPHPLLALHRKYAITWTGVGDDVIELCFGASASGSVLETTDAGATWEEVPAQQVYCRLYGIYTTPGPDYDVPRQRLANVAVTLQIGARAYSRLETSIPLSNRPEILAAYWRADFDVDPTVDDVNGDAAADWQATDTTASDVASPASYDPVTLVSGVWHASGKLSTQPDNDFVTTTIVDVGLRDTVPGGSGAVMRINADRSAGLWSPLVLRVQLQSDGTQTLTLAGKTDDATEVVLYQQDGLPSDFVHCRLTILPDNDLVNIQIDDLDQGTYTYYSYLASGSERDVSLYGDTDDAEFDYAEIRVLE